MVGREVLQAAVAGGEIPGELQGGGRRSRRGQHAEHDRRPCRLQFRRGHDLQSLVVHRIGFPDDAGVDRPERDGRHDFGHRGLEHAAVFHGLLQGRPAAGGIERLPRDPANRDLVRVAQGRPDLGAQQVGDAGDALGVAVPDDEHRLLLAHGKCLAQEFGGGEGVEARIVGQQQEVARPPQQNLVDERPAPAELDADPDALLGGVAGDDLLDRLPQAGGAGQLDGSRRFGRPPSRSHEDHGCDADRRDERGDSPGGTAVTGLGPHAGDHRGRASWGERGIVAVSRPA